MRAFHNLAILLLFISAANLVGCGDDSTGTTEALDVTATLGNGDTLATVQSHWDSGQGTSWSHLFISFFADGSGELHFGNDQLDPIPTRQRHDFTWIASGASGVRFTVTYGEGETADFRLTGVEGDLESETFSATLVLPAGTRVPLTFLLGEGALPCC